MQLCWATRLRTCLLEAELALWHAVFNRRQRKRQLINLVGSWGSLLSPHKDEILLGAGQLCAPAASALICPHSRLADYKHRGTQPAMPWAQAQQPWVTLEDIWLACVCRWPDEAVPSGWLRHIKVSGWRGAGLSETHRTAEATSSFHFLQKVLLEFLFDLQNEFFVFRHHRGASECSMEPCEPGTEETRKILETKKGHSSLQGGVSHVRER